jgi:hypothetical protein
MVALKDNYQNRLLHGYALGLLFFNNGYFMMKLKA